MYICIYMISIFYNAMEDREIDNDGEDVSRVIDSHEWENKMVIRLIHGKESLVGFQSDRGGCYNRKNSFMESMNRFFDGSSSSSRSTT